MFVDSELGLGLLSVSWPKMARRGRSGCDKASGVLAGLVFLCVLTWDSLDNIQGLSPNLPLDDCVLPRFGDKL